MVKLDLKHCKRNRDRERETIMRGKSTMQNLKFILQITYRIKRIIVRKAHE
jgi:hypothetical protein